MQDFNFKNNIEKTTNLKSVISGYFTFNNIPLLEKELINSTTFELALKGYNNIIPFKFKNKNDWLDFGHSNLYYKSKRNLNVTRSFNSTRIINNHIKKKVLIVKKSEVSMNGLNNFLIILKCTYLLYGILKKMNKEHLI